MELVLTSYRYRGRELLKEIGELGDFRSTEFKDVIRGRVEDLEGFLRGLDKRTIPSLSRVTPIERSFRFSPERVVEEFVEAVEPLVERIRKGETFCVRVERRGLKGVFSSQLVAREVGTFISNALKERDGEEHKVDLEDPDKAVVIETLGDWCGVGVIPKALRMRYPQLRLP
ncbi:MAG: THUMP domain-containing protein [Candidatus Bathyarchaeia archaeon]